MKNNNNNNFYIIFFLNFTLVVPLRNLCISKTGLFSIFVNLTEKNSFYLYLAPAN